MGSLVKWGLATFAGICVLGGLVNHKRKQKKRKQEAPVYRDGTGSGSSKME